MKKFIEKNWKYILTAIIAMWFGLMLGPSNSDLNDVIVDYNDMLEIAKAKEEAVEELEVKNKELNEKIEQAAPWFEMQAVEQAKVEAEAKVKADAEAKEKKDMIQGKR